MKGQVIICNCKGDITNTSLNKAIEAELYSQKTSLIKLDDLCGLCATQKDKIKEIFSGDKEFTIIACHSRAVKLLLQYAGIDPLTKQINYLNLRENKAETIIEQIKNGGISKEVQSSLKVIESDPEWPSWFPVIDYTRCTNCGQCADFCLFGVYNKENNKVVVINPQKCKNNCPACARICPRVAIVFPKFKEGGAISGSDNVDEINEQKRKQKDINTILGSDIYKTLELRKKKRQSIIKQEIMNKALEEREKALKK